MSDNTLIHRGTGLLVVEVLNSNPNGDPDREGEPRTRGNGIGEISPVSVKRKLRDLVEEKKGFVWRQFKKKMGLDDSHFKIIESHLTDPNEIKTKAATDQGQQELLQSYWDVRVFGSTYLQSSAEGKNSAKSNKAKDKKGHRFIHSGVAHFVLGTSLAPVKILRLSNTRKANPEEDKSGGMAPMGYRVVEHGVYTIPFFVNPNDAKKMGTEERDINLMLQLLPHAYAFTRSAVRPNVQVQRVWYARHNNPLGCVNDIELIQALKPVKITDPAKPSSQWEGEYDEPVKGQDDLPEKFKNKIKLVDYADL